MVQMVFVHGVATRSANPAYAREQQNREKLFKEVLFDGKSLTIRSPCWGDLVPALSHKGAAFAGAKDVQSFAAFGGMGIGGLGIGGAAEGNLVAELAKQDSTAALDAIYATMVDQADRANTALSDDEIAAFKAITAAMPDGKKPPLPAAASDAALIINLGQGYAIGSRIKDAVIALAERARNTISTGLSNALRDELNPMVGLFLGDVFVYLKQGEVRDKIRAVVREAIVAAHADAKAANAPLILMGHSLGGVILYDMLSSPKSAGLPQDLKVDAFITVGSQPGLFEEMGLFEFRNPGAAANPVPPNPAPECVNAWQNIFDPIDLFGFRAKPIFAKVEDFAFDSVTGLLSAHTTYFKRPQFYARMRARLSELGLA